MNTAERLSGYLREITKKYPGAWEVLRQMRRERGHELPNWPSWCYLPYTLSRFAIETLAASKSGKKGITLTGSLSDEQHVDASILAALANWRQTQGIYRFDETLSQELTNTEDDMDLPGEIFYRLPEWCIYIEISTSDSQMPSGAFVFSDWDLDINRSYLHIIADSRNRTNKRFLFLTLFLDQPTVGKSLAEFDRNVDKSSIQRYCQALSWPNGYLDYRKKVLSFLLPKILYLCSISADVYSAKGKKPFGYIAISANEIPKKPINWNVGYRIGTAIRAESGKENFDKNFDEALASGSHASPRPHVRRAHWHHYWRGPLSAPEKRELILKWIPPLAINTEYGEIIPVYRQVKDK